MEVPDDATATMNWEPSAHVRLVDNGSHRLVLLRRVDLSEYLHNIAYAEEAVGVLEHLGLISREIGRQGAVFGAAATLVFASSAGLAGAAFNGHNEEEK